eukprot:4053205-Pleurochrysis_carterae.AAC.1
MLREKALVSEWPLHCTPHAELFSSASPSTKAEDERNKMIRTATTWTGSEREMRARIRRRVWTGRRNA